jgi:hypothetical protein
MLLASERELQKSVALNIGAGVSSPAPSVFGQAQSRVTTVQSVTYVAGPVTVQ